MVIILFVSLLNSASTIFLSKIVFLFLKLLIFKFKVSEVFSLLVKYTDLLKLPVSIKPLLTSTFTFIESPLFKVPLLGVITILLSLFAVQLKLEFPTFFKYNSV